MKSRRLISLLLCICMTASSIVPVLALDNEADEIPVSIDEILSENNDTAENSAADEYAPSEVSFTAASAGIEQSSGNFMVPVEPVTEVPEGYIGIYTAEDLDNVRNEPYKNYILMNDIDLSGYENWVPIDEYNGTFDGNGHTISNMRIYETNADEKYYGLFGKRLSDAVFKDLGITDSSIYVNSDNTVYVGTIYAYSASDSEYKNCYTNTEITVRGGNVVYCGGITGRYGSMVKCVNYGDITVEGIVISDDTDQDINIFVGGCCGNGADTVNCSNYGGILSSGGHSHFIGGIVGNSGTHSYGINYGIIEVHDTDMSDIFTGGICGRGDVSYCTNNGMIKINSYNASQVIVGGILGDSGNVYQCANKADISVSTYNTHAVPEVGGVVGTLNARDISCCANSGNIMVGSEYSAYIGGIMGYGGDVYTCYNDGNIEVYAKASTYVGGLKGYHIGTSKIVNSYNTGTIYAVGKSVRVAGLIGGSYKADVYTSYNTGNIETAVIDDKNNSRAGDLFSGEYITATVDNSYYLSSASIIGDTVVLNGTPLGEDEFCDADSFVGFDFDTVWEIGVTDGYPYPTLRENPHVGGTVEPTPESNITTDFDTSEITLCEGDTFDFIGTVTSTAENGLNNIQVNIQSVQDSGAGIIWHRAESVGTPEYSLSTVPSFIAGESYSGEDGGGNTQTIALTAGTSWYVQLYATDNDGNSLGNDVWKKINIVENEAQFLIGNKYLQTTNTDGLTEIPYIYFESEDTGVFYIVDTEPSLCFQYPFTYTVSGETVTLTSTTEGGFHGTSSYVILQVIDNNTLEVVDYEGQYMLGWTRKGDRFEIERQQVKPTVTGLKSNYTITQGEDLQLEFTVTAGESGLLNKVTIAHNAVGTSFEPVTFDVNYSANTLTTSGLWISCLHYPLNTIGTHEFIVYASADNYTVTDNAVATFTVTVREKQVIEGEFEFSEQGKRILMNLEGSIVDSNGMHLLYDDDNNYSRACSH